MTTPTPPSAPAAVAPTREGMDLSWVVWRETDEADALECAYPKCSCQAVRWVIWGCGHRSPYCMIHFELILEKDKQVPGGMGWYCGRHRAATNIERTEPVR